MNLKQLNGVILDSNSEPMTTLWNVFRAASCHPQRKVITKVRYENSNSYTQSNKTPTAMEVQRTKATAPILPPFLSIIKPCMREPTISPKPIRVMHRRAYIVIWLVDKSLQLVYIVAVIKVTKVPLKIAKDMEFQMKLGMKTSILPQNSMETVPLMSFINSEPYSKDLLLSTL